MRSHKHDIDIEEKSFGCTEPNSSTAVTSFVAIELTGPALVKASDRPRKSRVSGDIGKRDAHD